VLMAAALAGSLAPSVAAAADRAPPARPDMSCAWFSSDPDDRSGPPIRFVADLSADEESALTESPGTGRVEFTLERRWGCFSWSLRFAKLTSLPTGIHVRGPQTPGGEAGILIDLAPRGVRDGVEGSTVLDDGLLGYLVQDRMYVNLLTKRYPAGELRGPVRKVRPDCSRALPLPATTR
jgi:hypothetical protein